MPLTPPSCTSPLVFPNLRAMAIAIYRLATPCFAVVDHGQPPESKLSPAFASLVQPCTPQHPCIRTFLEPRRWSHSLRPPLTSAIGAPPATFVRLAAGSHRRRLGSPVHPHRPVAGRPRPASAPSSFPIVAFVQVILCWIHSQAPPSPGSPLLCRSATGCTLSVPLLERHGCLLCRRLDVRLLVH
ncbi:hypothetical protein D1007_45832 [Hordeum vulgare]|nr:hypothetical protein D1007_45832 [Hordeum vulgare]